MVIIVKNKGSFPLVALSLAYINNDLLCNDPCFVTEGCITYRGYKRKRSKITEKSMFTQNLNRDNSSKKTKSLKVLNMYSTLDGRSSDSTHNNPQ